MATIRWSPAGQESLVEIGRHAIEKSGSLDVGPKLIDSIEAKCQTYAQFPEAGTAREDLGAGMRCFPAGNYVVIYRPVEDGIRVVIVAHGHQDLHPLIRGIPESEL